jgi:hypothetical protein
VLIVNRGKLDMTNPGIGKDRRNKRLELGL